MVLLFIWHIFNGRGIRFLVREFAYSDEQAQKQQEELDIAGTTEKELWVSAKGILNLTVSNVLLPDRTATHRSYKLLRSDANPCTPEGCSIVCGKCASVRFTSGLHRTRREGDLNLPISQPRINFQCF